MSPIYFIHKPLSILCIITKPCLKIKFIHKQKIENLGPLTLLDTFEILTIYLLNSKAVSIIHDVQSSVGPSDANA